MCKVSAIDNQALLSRLRDRTWGRARLQGNRSMAMVGIPLPAPQELHYPLEPGPHQRFVFQRYESKGVAIYAEAANG